MPPQKVFLAKEKADALRSYEIWKKRFSQGLVVLHEDHITEAGSLYKIVVSYRFSWEDRRA